MPYDASIPIVCNKKNHPLTLGLPWVICLHSCFPAFITSDASSSRELSLPNLFCHRQIWTSTMAASHSYEFKAISSRFPIPSPISNFTLQIVSSTIPHPLFYRSTRDDLRPPSSNTKILELWMWRVYFKRKRSYSGKSLVRKYILCWLSIKLLFLPLVPFGVVLSSFEAKSIKTVAWWFWDSTTKHVLVSYTICPPCHGHVFSLVLNRVSNMIYTSISYVCWCL
jgi:hypothetical protein